jgi:LAS superfamily LD-carboxypeptidase LdcB
MAEQLNLSGLSQKIENFSAEARNQTTSFRQSASEHNRSITKFVKDIASHFTKQNGSLEDISLNMKESSEASAAVSRKIDNQSSVINQSINIQSSMLNELQRMNGTLAQVVRELKDNSKTEGEGTGGAKGIMSSIASLFTKRNALIAGGAAAVVGGGIGTYNAGSNTNFDKSDKIGVSGTEDQKVDAILQTIKGKESSGNYKTPSFAEGKGSTASGGYQFADATWQEQAGKIGVDVSQYKRAKDAPPEVQDAVARSYVKNILARNDGNVAAVPKEWYAGPKGYLTDNESKVNKGLTVEKYQSDWMQKFNKNATGMGLEVTKTKPEQAQQQQSQPQQAPVSGTGGPQQTPSAVPSGGGGGEQPQAQSTEKQGPTERSSPDEEKQFLQSRQIGGGSFTGVNADKLNSDFVHKLVEGIKFAEKASGEKIGITEGYRTPETQAQYYANYVKHPINYQGKTYNPDPRTGSGGLAAPPGQSNHQKGMAVDISNGRAREILRANASRFGLRTLGQKDLPHFESGSGSDESSQTSQGSTGRSYQTQGGMGGGGGGYGGGMAMGMQRPMMGGMGMGMGMNPMMGMMMGGRMGRAAGIGGLIGMGANILGNILSPNEERMPSARYTPSPPPRTSRELERTAVQDKVDERKPQQTNAAAPQQNTQQARQQPVNDPNKRNKVTSAKNPWADDLRKYYEKSMAS